MEKNEKRKERGNQGGLTLIEMMISLAILSVLITSIFSIAIETYAFIGDNEADFGAQNEANQAFDRMTEILRKCGWNTSIDGVTYPRVLDSDKTLEFRILQDLDGNGYAYKEGTGDLEWGATVYRIQADKEGILRIYNGDDPVWHLCRHLQDISFKTYLQDNTIQMKEIGVTVKTQKLDRRGHPIDFSITGTIDMRN